MKKYTLVFFIVLCYHQTFSQLLSWTPDFATESTTLLVITADATKGNQGLQNYTPSDVYVHIGVITSLSSGAGDWKYVKFNQNFNQPNPLLQAVSLGNNKYSFTITGGLRAYFGMNNPAETIKKIAILFRSGDGTKKLANADGSDMYIPVYTNALAVRITNPLSQPSYIPVPETITKVVGDNISVTAVSNLSATLKIYLNGVEIQTATAATSISATPTITTGGNQKIIVEANDGTTTTRDSINFFTTGAVNVAKLPAGAKDGINYDPNNAAATLVLYAPGKGRVCVIGEF
ncbi:MAG TPA: hypothetical protein VN726_07705, partial [Hanamia sp.]|nr:hypothetical protein [Hanamia sp.]